MVADADGSSPRVIGPRGDYLTAHFSAAGRRIVFTRIDRGARALLSYTTPTGPGGADPRLLRGVRYGVHTIGLDGRGSRRIATIRGGLIGGVAASPDGRRIVLAQNVPGGTNRLLGVSADGTVSTIRTVRESIGELAFSPGADRLAVGLGSRGSSGIYVMAAGGGALRRLTSAPRLAFAPVWSPDGAAIDFMGIAGDGTRMADAIYTVAADGGQPRRVRDFGSVDVLPVAWQPRR
jgi:hypothetical protein